MKWLWLLVLAGGCVSAPAPRLTGLYEFPAAADLHYPLLWLDGHGQFAFLADPDELAAASNAPNSGVYQLSGHQLRLEYRQTECCQFAGIDQEQVAIQAVGPEHVQVRFRDQVYQLQRITPAP